MKIRSYFTISGILFLFGCTVGPNFKPPQSVNTDRYTVEPLPKKTVEVEGSHGKIQSFVEGKNVPHEWWKIFSSNELNEMVKQALIDSPTIAKAKAKLYEAQALYNVKSGTTMYPNVNSTASATREQINFQSIGITAFPNPPPFTLYNIGINISYTFDLFGANRRELEALQAEVDLQNFDFIASQITLATNITTAVIQAASLLEQIQVTNKLIEIENDLLTIYSERSHIGSVANLNVINQKEQLARLQANLPILQEQLNLINNQIAIYLGKMPSEIILPVIRLSALQLPNELPLSIPSMLLRQRPDIQAAEALLHQACARVGVATANLYPNIKLNGSLSSEATSLSKLFGAGSSAWNIGPSIIQPIFYGGALYANQRASLAALEQAMAVYQETVLQGIQNVTDTLQAIVLDAKTLQSKAKQTQQARESYHIHQQLIRIGAISSIKLLEAKQNYYQSILEEIPIIANRYTHSAALFYALGGGWWNNKSY